MPALKAVVIIMGLLILGGIAVIAFTLVNRSADLVEDSVSEGAVETDGGEDLVIVGFGAVRLEGSENCRIAESAAEGDRLILRTEGTGPGCGRVHILDIRTGKPLGTIEAGGPN